MGWASGAMLAEEVWGIVSKYIPEEKRPRVAKQIIEAFRDEDWDAVDEAEALATAAGWYNEEEYDALCRDEPDEPDEPDERDCDGPESGGASLTPR